MLIERTVTRIFGKIICHPKQARVILFLYFVDTVFVYVVVSVVYAVSVPFAQQDERKLLLKSEARLHYQN